MFNNFQPLERMFEIINFDKVWNMKNTDFADNFSKLTSEKLEKMKDLCNEFAHSCSW